MPSDTAAIEALIAIIGSENILQSSTDTAGYLVEQRGLFESTCLAVITPGSTKAVSDCVKVCAQRDIGIVPMGGNTGLCGGAVSSDRQIILSLEKLNAIKRVDAENYSMTVQAGCILAKIQQAAADSYRLFPLSLGAEGSCQIGGTLSTNAGGINVLHYGNARDLCLGIEAVLADGSVYSDLNGLRKDNTGYSLMHLLIGAEGTLGIITQATLKLFPLPHSSATALLAMADLPAVIAAYNKLREDCGDRITSFELIPRIAVELTSQHFPEHTEPFESNYPWMVLMVVHSELSESALNDQFSDILHSTLEQGLIADAIIAQTIAQAKHFMALREKLVSAQKREGASIKHDVSVPIASIPAFIECADNALTTLLPGVRPYPFGHVGDGNIHYNICQARDSKADEFMAQRETVHKIVLDIVHQFGGSFSAEHGVGLLKRDLIKHYKGDVALKAMVAIKRALDPKNIMNPGKVIDTTPSSP